MSENSQVPEQVIAIKPKAIVEIKKLLDQEENKPVYLRIGAVPGGCSGFQYMLSFDNNKNDSDHNYEIDGISVVVDNASVPFLTGASMDFYQGENEGGFTFENPNVQDSCGCGCGSSCGC